MGDTMNHKKIPRTTAAALRRLLKGGYPDHQTLFDAHGNPVVFNYSLTRARDAMNLASEYLSEHEPPDDSQLEMIPKEAT